MSIINCPECSHEISDTATNCPNCGKPLRTPNYVIETSATLSNAGNGKHIALIVSGLVLEIFALIIFCSFSTEYIDSKVLFGSDYNSYTYQTLAYIAIALRYGLTGILTGLGTIMQFMGGINLEGKATSRINK